MILSLLTPFYSGGCFQLRRDYPKILRRLTDLIHENSKALLCCNDPMVDQKDWKHGYANILQASQRLKSLKAQLNILKKVLKKDSRLS